MSKSQYKVKHLGKSKSQCKRCVPRCKCYMSAGDKHNLCVVCLRARHAELALEGLPTLKQVVSQIRSEDWFVTIDLKDAYFHISILPTHRKLAPLHLQGIRILNYIGNWLILAQSEQMAVQHRDVVLAHMKVLRLRLNAKKSVLSPALKTTCLRHLETTLVLASGPGVGSSVSPRNASDGHVPHRLGHGHGWPAVCGVVAISHGTSIGWIW